MAANPKTEADVRQRPPGVRRQNRIVHQGAILVAVAIAIVGPAIFSTVGYLGMLNLRRFQADVTAQQVARYAYIQGPTWRFAENRVAELVRQAAPIEDSVRRLISSTEGGEPIIVGKEPPAPLLRLSAPIMAGARHVGTVTTEASLRPLLFDAASAIAVSLVLAIAAYTCVRLPLIGLRKAVDALRESEARFRSLAAAAPMAITILDVGGHVQWANREVVRRFGMSLDDLKGKTAHDIHTREIAEEIARLDGLVLAQRKPQIVEFDVRTATGNGWTEIHVRFPIEDDSGSLVGLGSAALDISSQRSVENQLRQALKMQVVGQLSGGVSHDFNNILQVIEANLALAKLSIHDAAHATELIDAALLAGRRGADLTTKLLAFSRQQTLSPSRIDINAWLIEETRRLASTLDEDVEILARPCGDAVDVIVDEGSLTSALLNLVLNAQAAMSGGGTITVSARRRLLDPAGDDALPAGDYVEVSVTDTGMGMTTEVLSRAFEPFFTTKEVGQGSGLGLCMVYGFARQSGGTVEIDSAPGQGTTVRILLPTTPAEDEAGSTDDIA